MTRRQDIDQSGSERVALAMDLGGNWVRAAQITESGKLLWRDRVPTNAQSSGEVVIARIEELLDRAISALGDREVAGVGLGLASPTDPDTGTMYSPPNIPGLDGVSFKSRWRDRLPWPVVSANDATVAALGECRYGVGVGARTLVYMTISTGIGGGIVVEGRPVMGAHGMAGELGHMYVGPGDARCNCGGVGCLEAVASGTAIAEAGVRAAESGDAPVLRDLASGRAEGVTAEMVFDAARRGDPASAGILDAAARALGVGLVNVLHMFNPDVIVIGGGVSQNWEYLRPAVEAHIESHAMAHIRQMGFRLAVSNLGDDNVLVGAAALVWQQSG